MALLQKKQKRQTEQFLVKLRPCFEEDLAADDMTVQICGVPKRMLWRAFEMKMLDL